MDTVASEVDGALTVEITKSGSNTGNLTFRVTPMTFSSYMAINGGFPDEFTTFNLSIPEPAEGESYSGFCRCTD